MSFDVIIRGGTIIDGLNSDSVPFKADVGIKADHIKYIGDLSSERAGRTIDAKGLCVCPGFIDAHAHSEFTLVADGRAQGKISQGVTTEINGNCGMSAAPLYGPAIEQRTAELEAFGIKERWNSFEEYFRILTDKGCAVNFITLVGHGNLRSSVAGHENRPLTQEEKKTVLSMLEDALNSGAAGLSTGLIYPPGVYSDTAELIGLARHSAGHGGPVYTTHMRSEGDELLESVDEAVRIGMESGIHVHLSHLKTAGKANWGKIREVFDRIDGAVEKGVRLTCDRYPYTAGSTGLDAVLPAWAFEGGREAELKRLRTDRKRISEELNRTVPDNEGWNSVVVSSVSTDRNIWMQGKSILEISRSSGQTPLECLFGILIDERLTADAIFFSMSEDNLRSILKRPYTMIGSDGSARSFDGITAKGRPHPRGFGTFPRVLGRYAREQGLFHLEEAVFKMTGLAAETFGIKRRGGIRQGYFADITVFDADRVRDSADYDDPFKKPEGIHYVFVNGRPAMWEGELTEELNGRILKDQSFQIFD